MVLGGFHAVWCESGFSISVGDVRSSVAHGVSEVCGRPLEHLCCMWALRRTVEM